MAGYTLPDSYSASMVNAAAGSFDITDASAAVEGGAWGVGGGCGVTRLGVGLRQVAVSAGRQQLLEAFSH